MVAGLVQINLKMFPHPARFKWSKRRWTVPGNYLPGDHPRMKHWNATFQAERKADGVTADMLLVIDHIWRSTSRGRQHTWCKFGKRSWTTAQKEVSFVEARLRSQCGTKRKAADMSPGEGTKKHSQTPKRLGGWRDRRELARFQVTRLHHQLDLIYIYIYIWPHASPHTHDM